MKVYPHLFVFNSATFFALFGLFGAIFGVGIRFKNIFGNYLCRQSTLFLKVQPYLFAFNSATFGASFALFGPLGAIVLALFLGLESGSKTFLELTNVDY